MDDEHLEGDNTPILYEVNSNDSGGAMYSFPVASERNESRTMDYEQLDVGNINLGYDGIELNKSRAMNDEELDGDNLPLRYEVNSNDSKDSTKLNEENEVYATSDTTLPLRFFDVITAKRILSFGTVEEGTDLPDVASSHDSTVDAVLSLTEKSSMSIDGRAGSPILANEEGKFHAENAFHTIDMDTKNRPEKVSDSIIRNDQEDEDNSITDTTLLDQIMASGGVGLSAIRNLTHSASDAETRVADAITNDLPVAATPANTLEPLRRSTAVVKQRTDDGEDQPGAYRMNNRAIGEVPAWIRNRRSRNNTSRSNSLGRLLRSLSQRSRSQRSSTREIDQSHLPPEMRTIARRSSESNENVSTMIAEVSLKSQPPNVSRKKRSQMIWIAIGAIAIVGIIIGLAVVLSGSNSDDSAKINQQDEKDEQNNVGSLSKVSEKCLQDGSFQDILEEEALEYRTLKEELFRKTTFQAFDYNISSCEAPNLALHWLVKDIFKKVNEHNDSLLDRYALAACYYSWMNGTRYEWKNATGWMTDKSICAWSGITCDEKGFVTNISLRVNRLLGSIPAEISLLNQLTGLDLLGNSLTGTLPTEIGLLRNLIRLQLRSNHIGGNIPTEIGQLTMLQDLVLGYNQINGTIPTNIGSCTGLQQLDFGNNNMNGAIPSQIGLLSNVEYMGLFQNDFSGSIPTSIGLCTNMRKLFLFGNSINGTIPSEIGLLSQLDYIALLKNRLGGPIPSTIRNLQNLTKLKLGSNFMTGTIPSEIGTCASLQTFDLSSNFFSGTIPTEIGSLEALKYLIISSNKFSGSIPSNVGNCLSLKYLDISKDSRMRGTVPPELESLSNLEEFIFHGTGLTGLFPDEVCSLREGYATNFVGNCGVICDCCDEILCTYESQVANNTKP